MGGLVLRPVVRHVVGFAIEPEKKCREDEHDKLALEEHLELTRRPALMAPTATPESRSSAKAPAAAFSTASLHTTTKLCRTTAAWRQAPLSAAPIYFLPASANTVTSSPLNPTTRHSASPKRAAHACRASEPGSTRKT